jgi:uncharacterized membrane protein
MPDAQNIVVLGFDTRLAAQEALTAALRLQKEGKLQIHDAVFVTKDEKGQAHVEETTDLSPGRAALGGAVWGMLFGAILLTPVAGMAIGAGAAALAANLVDTGLSDKFVNQLRQAIEPGKVYLALLTSHANREAVLVELKRFKGIAQLIDTTLPGEAVNQVKDALEALPTPGEAVDQVKDALAASLNPGEAVDHVKDALEGSPTSTRP